MPEETQEQVATEQTAEQTQGQISNEQSTQEPTEADAQSAEDSTLLGKKNKEEASDEEASDDGSKESKEEGKETEVPEQYEVKVPEGLEGVEIDTALVDKLSPVLKDLKIDQEGFQKLVDVFAPHMAEQVEAQRKASLESFNEIKEGWRTDTNKELGANAKEKLGLAASFIDRMAESQEHADQIREVLDETGVGNHVAVVKLLIKAGKAISEDSFPGSKGKTQPSGPDLSKIYDQSPELNKQ